MTAKDVASLVERELASYRPALTTQEYVGQRVSLDHELAEVEKLRANLVLPTRRVLHGEDQSSRDVWFVATADEYVEFYDENRREFGLGKLQPDGSINDSVVYGDLVGCFMAR